MLIVSAGFHKRIKEMKIVKGVFVDAISIIK